MVGPASSSGSSFALVDEWQLFVSPDAVTDVHVDTDAWGRGAKAFHPNALSYGRFIDGRVPGFRLMLRSGFA